MNTTPWYDVARRIAIIAGIFSALVLGSLAFNGLRSLHVTNMMNGRIAGMKAELRQHPDDARLKAELRKVDVQQRTEFFSRRATAQHGAWLLLGGLAVLLLSVKYARQFRMAAPQPQGELPDPSPLAARGRYAVVVAGAMVAGVLVGLISAPRSIIPNDYPAPAATQVAQENAVPAPETPVTTEDGTPAQSNAGNTAVNMNVATVTPSKSGTIQPGGPKPVPSPRTVAVDPAKQWPSFRGPGGSGMVKGTFPTSWDGAKSANVKWKTKVPLPGENSPVVWGDAVFLAGADASRREVYCFDANTGKLRWKQAVTGLANPGAPQVNGDTGYAAATMATDGRYACAIFANGDLASFDFSGKRVWAKNMGKPDNMYGLASSLAVYAGRLIVQFDQGSSPDAGKSALIALDLATGRQLWKTARSVPNSWSSPIVAIIGKRAEIITSASPWVIAYNPQNGKELWRAECLSGDVAPSPIYAGGMVFAVNTGSNLAAIQPGSGTVTPAWMYQDDLPDIVSPVSTGDLVYLLQTYGTLSCIDARTGQKVWGEYLDGEFKSSPTLVGANIYIMDSKGTMYILAAGRSYKVLGKANLDEASNCTPAFVNGRIYIRGKENLYCIGK